MQEEILVLQKISDKQAKKIRDEYKIKKDIQMVIYPHLKKAIKRFLQSYIRLSSLYEGIQMIIKSKSQEKKKIKYAKNHIEKICYLMNKSLEEIEQLIDL